VLQSSVISASELIARPSRAANLEAENRTLIALAHDMVNAPNAILEKLTEAALTLCQAQSAGVSLLDDAGDHLHWRAVAGRWAAYAGRTAPRGLDPSGAALDRAAPLALSRPERFFKSLGELTPRLEEALFLPFGTDGAAGVIWIGMHDRSRQFDGEDVNIMTRLAEFAGAAYQSFLASSRPSEEERRLREVINALPAAVYTTDAEGRLTMFNKAAAEFAGRPPQLGSDSWCVSWKLYWPDGSPMPHDECPMAMALKERRPIWGMEGIAERPDGTRVNFAPYPTPIYDTSGAMVGAVNMLVDISERKRIEEQVARRRDELAALYEFTNRLFRASSMRDVYDAALHAVRRGLSCDRASILLFDKADMMRFVAWTDLSEEYRRAVDGHSPWAPGTPDPQPICVDDIAGSDLPDSLKAVVKAEGIAAAAFIPLIVEGRLLGKFMAYYRDAHAFSQAEIALAETIARQLGFGIQQIRADEERHKAAISSALLGAIVAGSDDAIVSKDLNGIVTSWNPGAERVFGYSALEMIGRPIATLIPQDRQDEETEILRRIRSGERVDHYETIRQRKDGTLINISLTISPVRDGSGKIVGASKIARDVTERKTAQARHDMLTREIQHRTKNLFAVVQAVVLRSFSGKKTVGEAETAVVSRLNSLAQTHLLLMDHQWHGAELAEVVHAEMKPFAERFAAEGPRLILSAKAAQNFALALHELATNAAKYGALSNATGHVRITWSISETDAGRFTFCWQEQGGPLVCGPRRKGFGSTVLEQVMAEYFDAPPRMEFMPEGLRYEISGLLDSIRDERAA
jgi:PAS domain S-box-containing protein